MKYPKEKKIGDFKIQIHREHFNQYRLMVFDNSGNLLKDTDFDNAI